MKIIAAALLLFVSLTTSLFAQSKRTIPYPILFVHGWTGSDSTWYKEIDYLKKQGLTIDIDNNRHRAAVGSRIDFDLNADGLNGSSVLIRNGKAPNYGDVQDLQSIVDPNNDVFVINFDNGTLSNQASATKQGFAVGLAVKKILQATGAEKIILFGHSMGGLAIREYLQNRENWLHDTSTHSVAKLITSGTPHLGSNISSLINISIFWGKDENSEAVRDLRTNISGSFLNGGYEGTIPNNFKNKDINSNGIEKDLITGLNQKPIYTNLHYANIIGIGGGSWLGYAGSQDDDVVLAENANLFNIYPGITGEVYYKHNDQQELGDKTELTWHTKLVKQTKLNDQALDVPSEFNLAYGIKLNREYKGNFTQNADLKSIDLDRYKFENTDRGILTLAANVPDKSNVVLSNYEGLPMHDFSTKATVRLEAMSSYFLSVYGEAKEGFTFPYTFSTSFCPLPKKILHFAKETGLHSLW
jgi:pimeloyl-ACP methyl ester carboxylesterase